MIIPGVVLLAIFCYGPMAGIYTAFTKYNPVDGIFGSEFVGLQNFINMFDPRWGILQTLRNTIVIALLKFVGGLSWVYHFGAVVYLSGFEKIQIGHADGFLSAVFPVLGHDFGIAYNFLTANNGILNNLLGALGKPPSNGIPTRLIGGRSSH